MTLFKMYISNECRFDEMNSFKQPPFQMKVVKTRLLGAQPLMPIAQKNSYRVDAKNTVISAIQVSTEYPEHKFIFSFQNYIVELGTNKI